MRQIYEFWFGARMLTSVIADSETEARELAGNDTNVTISRDAPFEAPFEFRIRLARATVRVRDLPAEPEKKDSTPDGA